MITAADNNYLCWFALRWYCVKQLSRNLGGERTDVALIIDAEEMPY